MQNSPVGAANKLIDELHVILTSIQLLWSSGNHVMSECQVEPLNESVHAQDVHRADQKEVTGCQVW
jgi:hypothetical protein